MLLVIVARFRPPRAPRMDHRCPNCQLCVNLDGVEVQTEAAERGATQGSSEQLAARGDVPPSI
jgi:hypothetical protein